MSIAPMPESDQSDDAFVLRKPLFATTHWSVVLEAGDAQSPSAASALEKLCRTYWFPLYAFIQRKGYPEEDAKDLRT
jgi:RNA polymerase sigma-70 factor (ECF subfamily)